MRVIIQLALLLTMKNNAQAEYVYERSMDYTSVPVEVIPSTVTGLFLDHNNIVQLDNFPAYRSLSYLSLSYNYLWEFPDLGSVKYTLSSLNLNFNNISFINPERLGNLISLRYLYLMNNRLSLSSIPDVLGPPLFYLELSRNNLGAVPRWENLTSSLRYIFLSENGIKEIKPDDFTNMTSLTHIYMHGNLVNQTAGFPPLSGLVWLKLSANKLTQFPDLRSFNSLQQLFLESNQISCIDAELLSNLTSLSKLYLQNNLLTADCIPDVSHLADTLVNLRLDGNILKKVPSWPNMGRALTALDLNYNDIAYFTDSDLDTFPNVTTLNLRFNNITEFPYLPEHGPQLQTLDLYGNHIRSIPLKHLEPLKDCKVVDVGKNDFNLLPSMCFAKFNMTLTVSAFNSQLQCDVRLLWSLGAAAMTDAGFTFKMNNSKCQAPDSLLGQPVSSLNLETLLSQGQGFVGREYGPVEPPFQCYLPITSIIETQSQVECGILCSLARTCILYGYHSHAHTGVTNVPGTCALTTFGGTSVSTSLEFDWFALGF